MSEDYTELEVFIQPGGHFDNTPEEGAIVLLQVQNIDGDLFGPIQCTFEYGDELLLLDLVWSASRAGSEKIPYTILNKKVIDIKDHPLYGVKNEQEGLYHPTLPAGCYVLKELKVI